MSCKKGLVDHNTLHFPVAFRRNDILYFTQNLMTDSAFQVAEKTSNNLPNLFNLDTNS